MFIRSAYLRSLALLSTQTGRLVIACYGIRPTSPGDKSKYPPEGCVTSPGGLWQHHASGDTQEGTAGTRGAQPISTGGTGGRSPQGTAGGTGGRSPQGTAGGPQGGLGTTREDEQPGKGKRAKRRMTNDRTTCWSDGRVQKRS